MAAFRAVLYVLIAVFIGALAWTGFTLYARNTIDQKPYGTAFALTNQDGKPITEAAFRGKPSAVFFGYTHCPDVCPTTLYELDGWLKKVDPKGDRIKAYFVTVDPERDTPEIMKTYTSAVSKRIVGISGAPADVDTMLKGFGVYWRKVPSTDPGDPNDYTMDHTASVFLLDAKGRLRSTIAYDENKGTAETKLSNLVRDASS